MCMPLGHGGRSRRIIRRLTHLMFIQVSLNLLRNVIESLHISVSLSSGNIITYLLCNSTETFLIFIRVLQFKLTGIMYGVLHIGVPGRVLQTTNSSRFTVPE